MKWTGLPDELTRVPCSQATSACQASQPRPSASGRRIASPKPGMGLASGLRTISSSREARRAPAFAPAAKPALRRIGSRIASGARDADHLLRVVGGAVVDDDHLVAVAKLREQRGKGSAQLAGRVEGNEDDRGAGALAGFHERWTVRARAAPVRHARGGARPRSAGGPAPQDLMKGCTAFNTWLWLRLGSNAVGSRRGRVLQPDRGWRAAPRPGRSRRRSPAGPST